MKYPEKILLKLNEVFLAKLQLMCEEYLEEHQETMRLNTYDSPKWLQFKGKVGATDIESIKFQNSNGTSGFYYINKEFPQIPGGLK